MFLPPKQHAPIILEETFLLVKPDASRRHAEILAALHDAQFHVQMKQFTVTRDMAEAIVSRFPCVVLAQQRERGEGASPRTSRGFARDPSFAENLTATNRTSESGPSLSEDHSAFGSAYSIARHRTGESAHNEIHSQILRLTRKDMSDIGRQQRSAITGHDSSASGGGDLAHSTSVSSSALTSANMSHLLQGTCLALVIASSNAVEKAKTLTGPEDPVVASVSAPGSLRARFGTDVVRNAVFAAETPQDAAYLIERIFGYEPTPHALTHQHVPLTRDEARPSLALIAAEDPLQVLLDVVDQEQAALLPEVGAKQGRRGQQSPGHVMSAGNLVSGNRARVSLLGSVGMMSSSSPNVSGNGGGGGETSKEVFSQMTRLLQEERRAMQVQAKVLRIRELDLLLREQEFQKTQNPVAASHPSPVPPQLLTGVSARRASRRTSSLFAGAGKAPAPPLVSIEPDQIDAVISNPAKLVQIFQRLDATHSGRITREDFMKLYKNSPCLWKVGVPDHEEIVFHTLPTLGISVEYFGLAVLQLLR